MVKLEEGKFYRTRGGAGPILITRIATYFDGPQIVTGGPGGYQHWYPNGRVSLFEENPDDIVAEWDFREEMPENRIPHAEEPRPNFFDQFDDPIPADLKDTVEQLAAEQDAESYAYGALLSVLDDAYAQAAHGKGKERHANDKPFLDQPIMEVGRIVGPGFALGQVMKKAGEAKGMADRGDVGAAERELLGAIVYAAAAVLLIREGANAPTEE